MVKQQNKDHQPMRPTADAAPKQQPNSLSPSSVVGGNSSFLDSWLAKRSSIHPNNTSPNYSSAVNNINTKQQVSEELHIRNDDPGDGVSVHLRD
jgi:hypothetical protein